LKGVGICIARISASHFYLILPLALIEAVYKEKGYTVRWNENNDDENIKVDDEKRSAMGDDDDTSAYEIDATTVQKQRGVAAKKQQENDQVVDHICYSDQIFYLGTHMLLMKHC
jgi:hypothetical protein